MRSALLYLVLVGPPLLGLLGILEAGQRIVPPRSIGGDWQLDPAFVQGAAASCLGLEFGDGRPILRVSQSGTRAEVTFLSRSPLGVSASLRGDSLVGRGREGSAPACGAGGLGLRASVRGAAEKQRLSGTLTTGDCAACPGIALVAERRPGESGR